MPEFTDKKLVEIKCLIDAILQESKNQIAKWGIQTHNLDRWNTIISEEYGELSQAILEYECNNGSLRAIYNEAIQVATLSLKIAEMILFKMLEK